MLGITFRTFYHLFIVAVICTAIFFIFSRLEEKNDRIADLEMVIDSAQVKIDSLKRSNALLEALYAAQEDSLHEVDSLRQKYLALYRQSLNFTQVSNTGQFNAINSNDTVLAKAIDTTYAFHSIVNYDSIAPTIPFRFGTQRLLVVDRHVGIDYILQAAALNNAVTVVEFSQEEIGLLMRQKIGLINQVDNWKQIHKLDSVQINSLRGINDIFAQENKKLRGQQNIWKSIGLSGVGCGVAAAIFNDPQPIILTGVTTGITSYIYLEFIRKR